MYQNGHNNRAGHDIGSEDVGNARIETNELLGCLTPVGVGSMRAGHKRRDQRPGGVLDEVVAQGKRVGTWQNPLCLLLTATPSCSSFLRSCSNLYCVDKQLGVLCKPPIFEYCIQRTFWSLDKSDLDTVILHALLQLDTHVRCHRHRNPSHADGSWLSRDTHHLVWWKKHDRCQLQLQFADEVGRGNHTAKDAQKSYRRQKKYWCPRKCNQYVGDIGEEEKRCDASMHGRQSGTATGAWSATRLRHTCRVRAH